MPFSRSFLACARRCGKSDTVRNIPAFWMLVVLAVLLLSGGAWFFLRTNRSSSASDIEALPGAEVNIYFGRSALVIEGDDADPLKQLRVAQDGKPLPLQHWKLENQWMILAFHDPAAGPLQVLVETAHRSLVRNSLPERAMGGVLLKQIDLKPEWHLAEEAEPDPALTFTPDGQRIVLQTPSGLLLIPLDEKSGAQEVPLNGLVPEELAGLAGGDFVARCRLANPAPKTNRVPVRTRSLVRFDPATAAKAGMRWRFPKNDSPTQAWIASLGASRDGTRVACVLVSSNATLERSVAVVALDGRNGEETGRLILSEVAAGFGESEYSLGMLPDGSAAAVGSGDGQVWVLDFDSDGKPALRWRHGLIPAGQAERLQDHAAECRIAAGTEAFCVTMKGYEGPHWRRSTGGESVDLPRAFSTVQAFDARPETKHPVRLWGYEAPGRLQGLWGAKEGRWVACAYGREGGTDARGKPAPPQFGLTLLDLSRSGTGAQRAAYQMVMEGPLLGTACFSPDGRYLAVIQGPPPGAADSSTRRKHRLLLLH